MIIGDTEYNRQLLRQRPANATGLALSRYWHRLEDGVHWFKSTTADSIWESTISPSIVSPKDVVPISDLLKEVQYGEFNPSFQSLADLLGGFKTVAEVLPKVGRAYYVRLPNTDRAYWTFRRKQHSHIHVWEGALGETIEVSPDDAYVPYVSLTDYIKNDIRENSRLASDVTVYYRLMQPVSWMSISGSSWLKLLQCSNIKHDSPYMLYLKDPTCTCREEQGYLFAQPIASLGPSSYLDTSTGVLRLNVKSTPTTASIKMLKDLLAIFEVTGDIRIQGTKKRNISFDTKIDLTYFKKAVL